MTVVMPLAGTVFWYLIFGLVAPILVHELGHFAGARLVGASFEYAPLGPFMRVREGSAPRIRLRPLRPICTVTLPSDDDRASSQLAIATMSGPVLNLIVAGVLIVTGVFGATGVPQLVLVIGGILSLIGSLGFVIPNRNLGVPSDGRRLITWARGSPYWRRWVAIRRLTTQVEHGIRPRDWDRVQLEWLVLPSDGTLDDVAAAIAVHWHLLDANRPVDARVALERARLAASRHYMRQVTARLVLLELAYMEARYDSDPAQARADLFRSAWIARSTLLRALAAVQVSYSHFALAEETAKAGLAMVASLRPGFISLERDLLADLIAESKRRRGESVVPTEHVEALPSALDIDTFRQGDVIEAWRPPGIRSLRGVAGFIGTILAGSFAFLALGIAGLWPAIVGATITTASCARLLLFARNTRDPRRVRPARVFLTVVGIAGLALPLLATRLLRVGVGPVLWIAGQPKACATLAQDPVFLVFYLLLVPLAAFFMLAGMRAQREAFLPFRSALVALLPIGLLAVLFWQDPVFFAWSIGCG